MEERWIKQAAAGDTAAFEKLVLHYQAQIYRLCFRMVGHAEDAADLTQETFLRAWRTLHGFRFQSAFSSWLYRMASNLCIDYLRKRKRKGELSLTVLQEDNETYCEPPDPEPLPEVRVIAQEEQQLIQLALSALSADDRRILILRAVNDLSYAEIARVMGIRENTVKSRLSRARERLRKKLEKMRNCAVTPPSKKGKGVDDAL